MSAYPNSLMLEISRKCNLKCAQCYHINKDQIIDIDLFTSILKKISQEYILNNQELPILSPWFLSEPLMTKDLFWYLKIATDLGFRINLTTNGTILNKWESLITSQINYHLIVFSIDGLLNKTYKSIRKTSIKKVNQSIQKVIDLIYLKGLKFPICVKLTCKGGIEWEEVVNFVTYYLKNSNIKMVAVSKVFNDTKGLNVHRHDCKYLSNFFIIDHTLKILPCCSSSVGILKGLNTLNIFNPMESFFSSERENKIKDLKNNSPKNYCNKCQSAYTGEVLTGSISGDCFDKFKPVAFKQDFYNTFYFNPDYLYKE